ncbi:MAG: hypothetical protein Q9208_000824 [Pyrenodesmia sp. 3 TL-2023]
MFVTLSLLYLAPRVALAAYDSGSVSLWGDYGCGEIDLLSPSEQPVVIALNYTIPADVCHSLDRPVYSYRVDYQPVCADGNSATFFSFNGQNCNDDSSTERGGRPALIADLGPGLPLEGQCLALVNYTSFAFVCEGVGEGDRDGSTTSRIPVEPSSSAASTASTSVQATLGATPIAPGTSLTSPLYTLPGTVLSPTGGTGSASGGPLPTAGLAPSPAPSPFTGAASRFQASLVGPFALVVAGLVF